MLRRRNEVLWEQDGVHDALDVVVVAPALDQEDRKIRIRSCEPARHDAPGGAT